MGVIQVFPGAYYIQPETDPEKIKENEKQHQEWSELFKMVYSTLKEYGPESKEHQWSLIQYKKWQMERRKR